MYVDVFAEGSTAERVAMTTAALSAYVTIANTIHTIHREEVRGIAILLYNGKQKACFQRIRWVIHKDFWVERRSPEGRVLRNRSCWADLALPEEYFGHPILVG